MNGHQPPGESIPRRRPIRTRAREEYPPLGGGWQWVRGTGGLPRAALVRRGERMHRTNRVLNWVAGGLLGVGVTHGAAPAQQPPATPPAPSTVVKANQLVVTINGSKRLTMTPKRAIRLAANEKENIARLQLIPDDPGAVLVVGLQAG